MNNVDLLAPARLLAERVVSWSSSIAAGLVTQVVSSTYTRRGLAGGTVLRWRSR